MHTSELLCGYPQTSISSRVFYQILGFLGEIVGYQMIMNCTLCVVTLLASSVQPQRRRKREKERKKTLNVQHTFARFVAVIAKPTLSNLIEMTIRLSLWSLRSQFSSMVIVATSISSEIPIQRLISTVFLGFLLSVCVGYCNAKTCYYMQQRLLAGGNNNQSNKFQ